MSVEKAAIKFEGAYIYSPFTGELVESEDGVNDTDPSLLFIYYGNVCEYSYISESLRQQLTGKKIEDIEQLSPEELMRDAGVEGAFILEVDAGWNGVNCYGFYAVQR